MLFKNDPKLLSNVLVHLMIAAAAVGVGCASEEGYRGRALLSDGTPAGDLVELQTRVSEAQCSCISVSSLETWCYEIAWPDERPECMRAALQADADRNVATVDCYIAANRAALHCLQNTVCETAMRDDCELTLADAARACPQADELAAARAHACFQ